MYEVSKLSTYNMIAAKSEPDHLNKFEQSFRQVMAYIDCSKLEHCLVTRLRLHSLKSVVKGYIIIYIDHEI